MKEITKHESTLPGDFKLQAEEAQSADILSDCGGLLIVARESGREEYMKKAFGKWAALCLAAAVLGGCGSDGGEGKGLEDMRVSLTDAPDADAQESGGQDGSQAPAEGGSSSAGTAEGGGDTGKDAGEHASSQTLPPEKKAMYEAYVKVLEDIYFDQKFPGGMDHGLQPANADITDNMFAVYDIDADGREELIVVYTTTYTAGMVEIIYDYDSGRGDVREEHFAYPMLTYYDNGVMEVEASHNQGLASDGGADGNFWPYSLYRYDSGTDAYAPLASVDAWSRGFREEDYDGNPFPQEVDVDGDGVVYYVTTEGNEPNDPMDGAEYSQWRDSYLKGAKPLQVPYVNLTTDNIYVITNGSATGDGSTNGNGKTAGNAVDSGAGPGNTGGSEALAEGQILDQSFPVTLDGWGGVTFAPFAPGAPMEDENGQVCFGDVRFVLFQDGKTVSVLPGENEENIFYSQQFGEVLSVAFQDYNEDGRPDILVLLEYAGVQGPNIDKAGRTVRAYTQEEGEKDFFLDRGVSEYLGSYTDSMEQVYEGLASYAGIYAVATDKSAWEVDRFARKVKRLILAGDFQGLCGEIAFPITIDGTVYQDKEALLGAGFVQNTSAAFLETMREEPCGNMSANYQGIMMGDGNVWISEVLDSNLASQGLKVCGMNQLNFLLDETGNN